MCLLYLPSSITFVSSSVTATQHSAGMYKQSYKHRKDVQGREELFNVTWGSKLCVLSTAITPTPRRERLHGWACFPRGWKHSGMKTFWTSIVRQVRVWKKLVHHLPGRIPCTQRIVNNLISHTWTANLSQCRTRLRNHRPTIQGQQDRFILSIHSSSIHSFTTVVH